MPSESQDDKEANDVDEWTTIQKTTLRRRPQRRRNRNHVHDNSPKLNGGTATANHKTRDTSRFFESALASQLQATVDVGDSVTQEQIETTLETCLRELAQSKYWETVRQVLTSQAEAHKHPFRSIVCYGIGNFGTKRQSAPLWQLALAVLIRDYISTTTFTSYNGSQTPARRSESTKTIPRKRSVAMHYFEPLMTAQESKVLEKLGIRIIEENERGKRSVNNNGDNNNSVTLFFMPHCPMSLYTNLFHTNWDSLLQVIIFGNSLNNYIDGRNANIVGDPQKQQALEILEVLQPFWEVERLHMNKKKISDMSAYFEQAFNDSSFTSFATTKRNSTATKADCWPKRPQLDSPTEYDGEGEVV
jgi:hypothetical protein